MLTLSHYGQRSLVEWAPLSFDGPHTLPSLAFCAGNMFPIPSKLLCLRPGIASFFEQLWFPFVENLETTLWALGRLTATGLLLFPGLLDRQPSKCAF